MKKAKYLFVFCVLILILLLITGCYNSNDTYEEYKWQYSADEISTVSGKTDNYILTYKYDGGSYSLEYKRYTVSEMVDNKANKLFEVRTNSYNKPLMIEGTDNIYLCFSGSRTHDDFVYENHTLENHLTVDRYDGEPAIFEYNKSSGKVTSIDIPKPRETIITDAFIYNDELVYIAEKMKFRNPIPIFSSSWLSSKGYISQKNKKLSFSIIGDTPLKIKGCLVDNYYYIPTVNGIYRIDLNTFKTEKCLDCNLADCDYAGIFKCDDGFVIVKEQIEAYHYKEQSHFNSSVVWYSEDFVENDKKTLDFWTDNVIEGNNSLIISEEPTGRGEVHVAYVDFNDHSIISLDDEIEATWYSSHSPIWDYDLKSDKYLLIDRTSQTCKMNF